MLGLPIITGPHVFNAQDIADLFIDDGAAVLVDNAVELAETVCNLLTNSAERTAIGGRGEQLLRRNRGALRRLLTLLLPLVNAAKERR